MKVLVIGTGSIGRRHINVIQKDGHELAVCDVSRESALETANIFNIRDCYFDYREAPLHEFDAAVICTPNAFHAGAGVYALSKGCHVLMEKPIAHTTADGEKLVNAASEYGRVLMVGYILRVYPGLEEVKQILESERLGKAVSVRVMLSAENTLVCGKSDYRRSYETGGGIIFDYSHEIDYLRYLFGEPARLACFKDLRVRKGISCDDVAEMIMQFESGVTAGIHMDYIQEYGEYQNKRVVEIICEKGLIRYDFASLKVQKKNHAEEHIYAHDRDELFLRQFRTFVNACNGQSVNIVTGENALKTLIICEELYRSDKKTAK